jgi:hypothetical protein
MTQRDEDRLSGGWRPPRRKAVVAIRPGVIRNLIAGIVLIVLGPALVAWAASWPKRAWFVSAVFIGHGLVLTMWGIICLVLAALRKND